MISKRRPEDSGRLFLYWGNKLLRVLYILPYMKKIFISFCLSILYTGLLAQTTFVKNGPANNTVEYYAYTHALVYINAQTIINDATILVKKGKIVSVTANGIVPKQAIEVNLSGKTVYPSFVDLYSDYGITQIPANKKQERGEQFNSNKLGAYAWNEALKPETDAATLFNPNMAASTQLIEMGIGAVLTGNKDGICRGANALVSTANKTAHQTLLATRVAAELSFNKGSSAQPYPSSLMGSIALIKQTYHDAAWYAQQQTEQNLSLEAFNKLTKLPTIFDAGNKQNVLRAALIGKEFGVKYLIKTNGDEYQRITEIKQLGMPLIVPINFPKAYKVTNAFDADLISTADLKHWELAPANLYWLWKNNVAFCITAQGCNSTEFLTNLRKAVNYGLPKAEALKALTQNPAQLINKYHLVGQLAAGTEANFIICTGDLFEPSTQLITHVVQGQQYTISKQPELKLANHYEIKTGTSTLVLNTEKHQAYNSTDTFKLNENTHAGIITLVLEGAQTITYTANISAVDSSKYPYEIKALTGFAHIGSSTTPWLAQATINPNQTEHKKENKVTLLPDSLIWYPFNDYGAATTPKTQTVLFKNATVWTNEAAGISTQTDVLISEGKIKLIGKNLTCTDCNIIDASNKHLTSGIIDEHSHIAISQGVNEGTQAVTSEVSIGDVVNADDINIYRQLAGGVIASQLLHGSANPVGGQSALIKLRWGLSPEKMKIENAPHFIKFALGENVKQANWGDHSTYRYPQTRMGVEQVFIDAFNRAKQYEQQLKLSKNVRRDLELDALVEILNSKRFITCHSYVQSEINMLMHVADTFGFKVNTFTHILEGYKVADKMKRHGVNASTFADWWAYKYEVIDAIPHNAGILHRMGVTVAINSDDAEMGRRLNQEAAKIIKYTGISEEDAWKMVTLNPAKMLHIDNRTGSIKIGKDADIVLWNNNPLSIYAKPEMTFVDGICYYSLATDEQLRKQIAQTRSRLITLLLQAQKNGTDTQSFISEPEQNYHCND